MTDQKRKCKTCGSTTSSRYFKKMCRNCYEKDLKVRNPEYKQRQKENHQKWLDNNRDKVNKYNTKRRKQECPDKARNRSLKSKYGITLDDYNNIWKSQNGLCKICEENLDEKTPHLDHCHKSNQVRAILCSKCNNGLGFFNDDPRLFMEAMLYLQNRGKVRKPHFDLNKDTCAHTFSYNRSDTKEDNEKK